MRRTLVPTAVSTVALAILTLVVGYSMTSDDPYVKLWTILGHLVCLPTIIISQNYQTEVTNKSAADLLAHRALKRQLVIVVLILSVLFVGGIILAWATQSMIASIVAAGLLLVLAILLITVRTKR